ncbi:MAG: GAF domain-containing protein, partial [Candidatus Marithrix sp.]|nr:GAF domain-containing protein [Candidatus Marithrix sp.]
NLTTKMYNHPLQVTRAVLNANIDIIKIHRHMKDVALANNLAEMEAAKSEVIKHEQQVYEQFKIVEKWILGNEGTDLIIETIIIFRDWAPIRNEVIKLMENGKKLEAATITKNKGAKHVALLDSKMEALSDYASNKATGMYENSITTYSSIITVSITVLVLTILLGSLLGLTISRGIVKSVRMIRVIANKMVAGEITNIVTNRTELDKIIALGDEISDIGKAFDAIANSFKTVIDDISQISQGLATGDLSVMPKAEYQGDFVQIKDSLETGLLNLRMVIVDVVQISQGLADGNLRVIPDAKYNGDFVQIKDALDIALSNLKFLVEDIVQISQELAIGQAVTAKAEYQGDFSQVKIALETAATKLVEATNQNITQDWLKTGQTKLNKTVSGEQDMTQLAKNIITLLANYLHMSVGLFYLYEQDTLKLVGSYAYTNRKGIKHEFATGEGLVGQVALEQKQLHITKVPTDYNVHINSGLGTALPNNLLIQPVIYEGKLKAVIEFASFKTVTETDKLLLNQAMSIIGVAINTAESRSQRQVLLDKSQQQ